MSSSFLGSVALQKAKVQLGSPHICVTRIKYSSPAHGLIAVADLDGTLTVRDYGDEKLYYWTFILLIRFMMPKTSQSFVPKLSPSREAVQTLFELWNGIPRNRKFMSDFPTATSLDMTLTKIWDHTQRYAAVFIREFNSWTEPNLCVHVYIGLTSQLRPPP